MSIILFALMLRKYVCINFRKQFFGSYEPISDQPEKMAFPQKYLPLKLKCIVFIIHLKIDQVLGGKWILRGFLLKIKKNK